MLNHLRIAFCVCVGFDRSDYPALPRSRAPSRIPCPRRHCRAGAERAVLRPADVGIADSHVAALFCLAGDWLDNLFPVQPASERVREEVERALSLQL